MIKITFLFLISIAISALAVEQEKINQTQKEPIKIAVAGLTHDHVHWIFGRKNKSDINIVGIFESNKELQKRYHNLYNLDSSLFYDNLEEMLDTVQPEAITAFGSTFEHLALVEASAPRGIHVMVEKPLAVNMEHANRMRELSKAHNIHLITNYETTWYSSNHAVYNTLKKSNELGEIRKMVVHDGHQGPKEIGVSDEFLTWLTDPILNGGGAIMDFGCYGANLITWLMDGQKPVSVTAVTQTHKPDIYRKVDDEATIIVTYPNAQGIIQASWNWPYNRKDLQVYGETGYIYALNDTDIQQLNSESDTVETTVLPSRSYPFNDPFSYLAAVVNGDITLSDTDLSSLENNVMVVQILDAARESANTGRTVYFDE